jgi:hypothetical protein
MRFMVIVKATEETEAGTTPPAEMSEMFEAMGKFNEELLNAGIMLDAAGLQPSSKGVRIKFDGDKRTVIDGPFAETKELVAGYWIWEVRSKEEAIEWAKRIPNPTGAEGVVEIRKLNDAEDFGEAYTPELREQEERQAERMAAQKQA